MMGILNRCCLALLAMGLVTLPSIAQQDQRVDDVSLKNAAKNGDDWLTTSRDYAETRYSPLKQIDTSNVARLGLAWYYETQSDAGALEATPTVWNGILYGTLPWSVVFAVDATTGKEKWRYDPHINHQDFPPGSEGKPNHIRTGPTLCCGPVNRGVALYDGKVYVGLLDGRLVALDAETGKLIWMVHTTKPDSDYTSTGAPRIIKGKVILGNAGAEFAVRGYVSAYDAETGKLSWRFYIVPGDPSKPYENKALAMAAKTWKGNEYWKMGGGGTPWDGFAYDPDLDLLYVGTGNGGPWSQHWRSPGGGDNLFLSSIVALRPETGEYVWHFQETPGDEWDYTATQGMILADLTIDGKVRKVIMQAPKNGFFYVIDRQTGQFISAYTYANITWATGVDQKTGRPIEAALARYDTKGSWISPGSGGVHSWHAMSFNPETGLVYIPGSNSRLFYRDAADFKYRVGQFNWAVDRSDPQWIDGVRIGFPTTANTPPPPPPAPGASREPASVALGGFLVAWDPITQKERWRAAGMNGGGTFTTAGNLVFACSNDGRLVAFSADKGEKLWEVKLVPGLSNPSTFELNGKQYVSVLAGTAGNGKLYAFVLDGHAAMPSAAAPPPGGKTTLDGVYTTAQADRGQEQFMKQCSICHGANLAGMGDAPALTGNPFTAAWNGHSAANLYQVMRSSMPKGNPNSLTPESYGDILAFIFKSNHFPDGSAELKSSDEALKSITILANRTSPSERGNSPAVRGDNP